jgi:hypothetical protein
MTANLLAAVSSSRHRTARSFVAALRSLVVAADVCEARRRLFGGKTLTKARRQPPLDTGLVLGVPTDRF